jgi:hypothetical protein
MNRKDVVFRTSRFNASKVGSHFINPCCFGEDLATWLQSKLKGKGIDASSPGQEDWGWYIFAELGDDKYFLGMNVNAADNPATGEDAEWRIMVERRRSLWQRITKRALITGEDAMLKLIQAIVGKESDFTNMHIEN